MTREQVAASLANLESMAAGLRQEIQSDALPDDRIWHRLNHLRTRAELIEDAWNEAV